MVRRIRARAPEAEVGERAAQNAIARSPILLARMLVPLYVSTFLIE